MDERRAKRDRESFCKNLTETSSRRGWLFVKEGKRKHMVGVGGDKIDLKRMSRMNTLIGEGRKPGCAFVYRKKSLGDVLLKGKLLESSWEKERCQRIYGLRFSTGGDEASR